VLYDVNRLGREVVVQAILEQDLTRHGARIEYVLGGETGTPEGELLKLIKGAIAVFENRQRVERSRRGKLGRVQADYPLVPASRAPFGYRYISEPHTGRLVIADEEAKIVRQLYHWLTVEHISSYEIAK
jgi:site-specific DNA recombinase